MCLDLFGQVSAGDWINDSDYGQGPVQNPSFRMINNDRNYGNLLRLFKLINNKHFKNPAKLHSQFVTRVADVDRTGISMIPPTWYKMCPKTRTLCPPNRPKGPKGQNLNFVSQNYLTTHFRIPCRMPGDSERLHKLSSGLSGFGTQCLLVCVSWLCLWVSRLICDSDLKRSQRSLGLAKGY